MYDQLTWGHEALQLRFEWSADRGPSLSGVAGRDGVIHAITAGLPLVDVLTVGDGHSAASSRLVHTVVGDDLRYDGHRAWRERGVHSLELHLAHAPSGLEVFLLLTSHDGASAFSAQARVVNTGSAPQVLLSVASFETYLGTQDGAVHDWMLTRGTSHWLAEGRWSASSLSELLPDVAAGLTNHNPRGAWSVSSRGAWSTGADLPVAVASSASSALAWAWEIQHNGGWRWEIGADNADYYFAVSGPTDQDHQWTEVLEPGGSFLTVPATIAIAEDTAAVVHELTRHRRLARRPHPDSDAMPPIYNDYMNTVNGDPTAEKLLPLIRAAAGVGAKIFCIDAGWYDDNHDWWDSVGEWVPSSTRFEFGLGVVIDHIRDAGMIPGLWLEPEVIGVNSPMADRLPAEAFLCRNGQRVVEQGRFHLDLRHPASVAHLDSVIDRLISEFGIGYFKLDYNINPGAGTDLGADSVGAGLLAHNRAHLAWIDSVLDRHPGLVLENCASGAMRMDFAMLSRMQLQSTSDQQDFRRYPPIAAAAPLSTTPEQAANWTSPQPFMTDEENALTLATSILGRFYLSGWIDSMSPEQLDLVRSAVALNTELTDIIRSAHPVWPLGLPGWDDPWVCLGLATQDSRLFTVWNLSEDHEDAVLKFPDLIGADVRVRPIFPLTLVEWPTRWDRNAGALHIRNPTHAVGARVFELSLSSTGA